MIYSIIDIECNGLLDTVNKIHCLCYHTEFNGTVVEGRITEYDAMVEFLSKNSEHILVGHNIIRYDIPVLEKILGIKINCRQIDTLALSWYLFPSRLTHGLGDWGADFGIEKPPIVDWDGLPVEDYLHRCAEDVRINTRLFSTQITYLKELYDGSIERIMYYLSYKLECAREQEEVMWRVDIDKCKENLDFFIGEREKKVVRLTAIMPQVVKYMYRTLCISTLCYM